MSLAAFAPAILDTIVAPLILMFLPATGGDQASARAAALDMLAGFNPETPDELRLAAEIAGFALHALDALGQAASPGMPAAKIPRLRSSAIGLSRESHKAQRKLDQLQRDRRKTVQPQPADAAQQAPKAAQPIAPATAKQSGLSWTQAYQKRQLAQRIAANAKKHRAAITVPHDAVLSG